MAKCLNRWYWVLLLFIPLDLVIAAEPLGNTLLARGSVIADREGGQSALKRRDPVFRKDIIRSGAKARAQFRMIDNARISLKENTVLKLEEYRLKSGTQQSSVVMELISGGLRTITGAVGKVDKKDYQLRTPVATIGIRGTMYQVQLSTEGVYVGAWRGQIELQSYSGKCNITLGVSRQSRFALINSAGECQMMSAVPQVFARGYSAAPEALGAVDAERAKIQQLTTSPRQELLPGQFNFAALLVGLGNTSLVSGRANTLDQNDALMLFSDNQFVSVQNDLSIDFVRNVGGSQVSWGKWDSYAIQDELDSNPVNANDNNGLLWAAYQPTDVNDVMSRSGSVNYQNVVSSLSQSSMGKVSQLALQMNVNFDNGLVTQGALSAHVPDHNWTGVFDGQVANGELALQFSGGALVHTPTGTFTDVSGSISGDFVGTGAEAIVGGFSMVDDANNANQIEGVFLLE